MFESILYTDPQAVKPACFCPRCGGECYWPSLVCIKCDTVFPFAETNGSS